MSAASYQPLAAISLVMAIFCISICGANQPPVLTTNKKIIISGTAQISNKISSQLKGKDPDNDAIRFGLVSPPDPNFIKNISLDSLGSFTFIDVCTICAGETSFTVKLTDTKGNTNTYTLKVTLQDRTTGTLRIHSDTSGNKSPSLLRWHIYLIILAAITVVGVVASLVMYNCCLFETDIYSAPMRRPNKIIDKSDSDKAGEMNPYARQRKTSLIVREAVRSGAADGTPYYGVRKSGVWIPTAPEDNDEKGKATPLRLMSLSEDPEVARARSRSIAPIRPAVRLNPIIETNQLNQMSWQDISAPRR